MRAERNGIFHLKPSALLRKQVRGPVTHFRATQCDVITALRYPTDRKGTSTVYRWNTIEILLHRPAPGVDNEKWSVTLKATVAFRVRYERGGLDNMKSLEHYLTDIMRADTSEHMKGEVL
ncbi:unnamed protein product, partial [Iphiclides podalirius]